ncbi:probable E3 ubiquitin-protein ligase RNF144A [Arachis ipaensis]|uniref:RBR-type E3 ubiquitin transferase n=1 Tax=Arachis hypogaea TaxID=3818 RepID=A0A444XVR6_ARAHY|nr:probable E3 ubiquitin-protein ligase RNF144A [Arachis ipaensis]XP_025677860.1 probable E3 ubiquitin-protein ligase RNF144A [Arachis hypogaea]QHN79912.1 putative E3 ubiquitin-protein ligase [Arachis hypogaea]RYQ93842.1 hypothetical protein Ahy_B09g100071 isoform A [Arachis hypogaea]
MATAQQESGSGSGSETAIGVNGVEDSYFSALFDDEGNLIPISDDKYADELQLQETIMSSLIASQSTIEGSSSSKTVRCLPSSSTPSSSRPVFVVPKTEYIELLDDDEMLIVCEICAETKGTDQMFRNKKCDHSFCSDCVTKHVATKIQESLTLVPCPGLNCKGMLELDSCRPMLPKEVLDRWDDALCEALFLAVPKFYCPFRDCSAMLLNENEGGEGIIREAECPFCHRLFCARCCVPWHPGVECNVLQSLNEDERGREDLLLRDLAAQKKWNRCPRCKFYVEKTEGCLHITCRCRFQFCYACGEPWSSTHGGCQRN